MANIQTVAQLAQESASHISGSVSEWTHFLDTAARLYRYPFPDQLLIHYQRPDATACASYTLWNDTMHRFIKKGSKGIALIDYTGDVPRIRHVFDVADTGESRRLNSRSPNLWKMENRHMEAVTGMLQDTHNATNAPLQEQLFEIGRASCRERVCLLV